MWAALAAVACDSDSDTCIGGTIKRCIWNEASSQYDRGCQSMCVPRADAGACQATESTDDAGQAVRTTYYSNDPRLAGCRD
jgi:hypothetical protein